MFWIYHGEDSFSQDAAVAELRAALGDPASVELNTALFDGRAALTLGALRGACDALPFLAPRRLVIVEGLLTRLLGRGQAETGEAEGGEGGEDGETSDEPALAAPAGRARGRPGREWIDQLIAYLPELPPTTDLVFLERRELPARHPLLKLADGEHGSARLFGPPRPDELPRWIMQRARHHGGTFAPAAAQLLAQHVGAELRTLDQEIAKLTTYAGFERPVSPQDVQALVPAAGEASVFTLVDALGQRNSRVAAQTLQRLLDLGEHPLGLLAMIVRQFRLLIQMKELAGAGVRPAEAARQLHVPTFVAEKLARQARAFSMPQLEAIYRELLALDVAIKSGEREPEIALDTFVAGLA